jgi:hypothetical protein
VASIEPDAVVMADLQDEFSRWSPVMMMAAMIIPSERFPRMDAALQKRSVMSRDVARACMERLAAVLKQAFHGAQISQVEFHSSTSSVLFVDCDICC